MLERHSTFDEIGRTLGISRQRVHQLASKHNLLITRRGSSIHKPGYWDTQPNPNRWLWRAIVGKNSLVREERWGLYLSLVDTLPGKCPILGIPLNYDPIFIKGQDRNNSPSLDRIDNSKGYSIGNVRVISMKANRIKSDATAGELFKIGLYALGNL